MGKSFKFNSKEFSFTLILPIIISILYIFFQGYKEQLALNRNNFSFWQIYTKDFINDNLNHYLKNLILIIIFSIAIFIVLSKINKEYLFKYVLLSVSLTIPLISYFSDKYIMFNKTQSDLFLGSSSLASALMGFFMFLIMFLYFQKINAKKTFILLLSIVIIPFLLVYYFRVHLNYLIVLLIMFILLRLSIKFKGGDIVSFINNDNIIKFLIIIFVYLILLNYAYPYDYRNINFLNHYFGISFGVIIGNLSALKWRLK